jgi:hypothetical protein
MHSSIKISSVLLALTAGLLLAVSGCKKETTLQFSECPVVVQNALTTNMPGVTFTKVEQETKSGGIVIYEAKGKQADGKEIEVKVTGDGSLVKIDR